ncbi:hypothetical protein DFJ73DRAFT_841861 [Zopfochytrium polystomum]|nr:hypothetical protein DFJ73DRAFT_841861 [Zopfochytrium polystomum]
MPAPPSPPPNHLVTEPTVHAASLHSRLPIAYHVYALPFSVFHLAWLYLYFAHYDDLFGSGEVALFAYILVIAANALAFLVCQWSVDAKAFPDLQKGMRGTDSCVTDPRKADVIKVIPIAHNGAGALCPIVTVPSENANNKPELHFFFQKNKFIYEDDKKQFVKLRFPYSDGKPFSFFCEAKGMATAFTVKANLDFYGRNFFDVPIPTFAELFREHAVAPFFVFQLFCVGLWFLDEMWYYSLFTLFMLFVFESTVVFQRLKNLNDFRAMSIKPYPINVYRLGAWTEIQTDDLLPGDLCSILRSKEETPVPADILVVDGSCIANEAMLFWRESAATREPEDVFDIDTDKNNVLFGGTKVLQVTPPSLTAEDGTSHGGCIGYESSFATIIYSTERVTANNLESLFFILFLLIFAIAAASYVWIEGTKNEERKRSKVLLDCILIVTSVVPPELPMELSLANPSESRFAGKVDVACFDKTGTLTEENLLVEGVSGLSGSNELVKPTSVPKETKFVLAAAHALVMLDDGVIGDPMEKNTLDAVEWGLTKDDTQSIKILRRFQFSSALKRMATTLVAVKGAPETLREMFVSVPKEYDDVYKHWARRGSRVLALGYKILDGSKASKPDSAKAIEMLNNSSHRCVMITGDNALTACHVAKEVAIVSRDVLILDVRDESGPTWQTVDESLSFPADVQTAAFDKRLLKYDLCATGRGLAAIYEKPCFTALLPRLWVYARVSPSQKEDILKSLKSSGFTTLMCGKRTWVLRLLDGKMEDMEKLNQKAKLARQKAMLEQQSAMRERFGLPPIAPPGEKEVITAPKGSVEEKRIIDERKEKLAKQLESLSSMLGELDSEVPALKFGDASVAAPFTSKLSTFANIVRQGRSTLVALIQMYKILALNCLISAYSMSVMYLAGIKQGDWQATVGGLLITVCFFGIAKSSAVENLSKKRPQANVFNFYIIISVLGQAAIHVASLIYIRHESIEYSEDLDENIVLDAEFQPNLLNSAVYLVSLVMQISTFAINYQGEPFRESLMKNRSLYMSIRIVVAIAGAAALEVSPALNEWMQLVPFPEDFKWKLVATLVFDFGGAWVVEQVCSYFFSDNSPRKELF